MENLSEPESQGDGASRQASNESDVSVSQPKCPHTSRLRRWVWLPGALLATIFFTVVVCVRVQSHFAKELADPRRARANGNPLPVRTAKVEERPSERMIGATGVTEPSQIAIVRFGQSKELLEPNLLVKTVLKHEGQFVRAGETLLEMDNTMLIRSVKHREAEFAVAHQQLQALRHLKEKGAASGMEVKAAELKEEAAKLDRDLGVRSLQRCQVTSPIDGYLDIVQVVPGALVDASTELTKILGLDPIHMRVDLPQERIADVAIGSEAEVVVDSFPQETFKGKVIRISPQVNPDTRILAVVVEVPNPQHRIKAGVSGFARFQQSEQAVIVPQMAITQIERRSMVFVVEDGRARIREVKTGPLVEVGMKQVVDGLQAGEDVVIYGQQYIDDGDRVNPDWRAWTRRS